MVGYSVLMNSTQNTCPQRNNDAVVDAPNTAMCAGTDAHQELVGLVQTGCMQAVQARTELESDLGNG
jgi:hypothetical protein